jgi:hypothetical protein
MPAISLVVCLYRERLFLERLLAGTEGCYSDLVVIHDGPEQISAEGSVEQLVANHGGRFFPRPRAFQQEAHWSFAWSQAKHDWILRLDADEVPSAGLQRWLQSFIAAPEPVGSVSGYTCIWPLWNGRKIVTTRWPAGRIFLFNKNRVRFFGMNEQTPIAEDRLEEVNEILEHRPRRKSYGFANLLWRRQASRWRNLIAVSLLGKPTDLACWRWEDPRWPLGWEQIRQRPFTTAIRRLLFWPVKSFGEYWRHEHKVIPAASLPAGIHYFLIALRHWRKRRGRAKS